MIMSTKELKYNHYLLRVEDETSRLWSNMILAIIKRRILDDSRYYFGLYVPKYINFRGQEVNMKKGEIVIQNVLTQRHITMNSYERKTCYVSLEDMMTKRAQIRNLRATIYQLSEKTVYEKNLKIGLC